MIKAISINNFGPLEFIKFDCKKFNVFQGKSHQGKTSIIQAIKWAIVGGNDEFLVRNGSSTCEVILYSDNGSRIVRRLTRGGTSKLYIYDAQDKQVNQPQETLNKLFNPLLFGPTDIIQMKPKDMNEFVSSTISKRLKLSDKHIQKYKLTDIDLNEDPVAAIQAYYDKLFDERTKVNKLVKTFETRSSGVIIERVNQEEIVKLENEISELTSKIDTIKENNIRLEASKKTLEVKIKTQRNIDILSQEIIDAGEVSGKLEEYSQQLTELKEKLKTLEKDLDTDRSQVSVIKATLDKISSQDVKCPINSVIKCTTDMNIYRKQLTDIQEDLVKNGKLKFEKSKEINEEVTKLQSNLEIAKNIKQKIVELERAKSILNELEIVEGTVIDTVELERALKEKNELLTKYKISIELNKVSGIDDSRNRQAELNELLEQLNQLIKEVIPNMLTLNVKNVTLAKDGLYFNGMPFYRLGDSYKLRLCTALLKDLFPNANIFTLDRMECIDSIELKKYIEYYAAENNHIQYFGTYVGSLNDIKSHNTEIFTMEGFKINGEKR